VVKVRQVLKVGVCQVEQATAKAVCMWCREVWGGCVATCPRNAVCVWGYVGQSGSRKVGNGQCGGNGVCVQQYGVKKGRKAGTGR